MARYGSAAASGSRERVVAAQADPEQGGIEGRAATGQEPAREQELLAQFGHARGHGGEVAQPAPLAHEPGRAPRVHRVVDEGLGTEVHAGSGPARPPAEPDVLAELRVRPAAGRPGVLQPALEAADALEQLAAEREVRRFVEAGLAFDPEGAVERTPGRAWIGATAPTTTSAPAAMRSARAASRRGRKAVGIGEDQDVAGRQRGPGVPRRSRADTVRANQTHSAVRRLARPPVPSEEPSSTTTTS